MLNCTEQIQFFKCKSHALRTLDPRTKIEVHNSRDSDQNGVSLLYIMLEKHHSGWEPSNNDLVQKPKAVYIIC